jgi:ribosome-binding protein aMBF1 (putative translation factor)
MATNHRLRTARTLRGWRPRQLAEQVHPTEIGASPREPGRATPAPDVKVVIARELGIATWEVAL